jgi:hypothetical protein
MKNFNELKSLIAAAEDDANKFFEKGNASAGTRLRIAMQNIKTTAQAVRIEVSEAKSGATKKPAPAAAKKAPVAKKK